MALRATLGGLVDISIDASATILVAASNSLNPSRTTYQCDGTADNVQITAAIAALPAGGGKIMLTEGTFNFAAGIVITESNVVIEGMGNSTIIATPALADDFFKFTTKNYVSFSDFSILGTNQTAGNGIEAVGSCTGCSLNNVQFVSIFGANYIGDFNVTVDTGHDILPINPNLTVAPAGALALKPGTYLYLGDGGVTDYVQVDPSGRVSFHGIAAMDGDLPFDGSTIRKITISGNSLVIETLDSGDIVLTPFRNVDFTDHEAANFRLENCAVDPGGLHAGNVGKIWFDTATGKLKMWNGTAVVVVGP